MEMLLEREHTDVLTEKFTPFLSKILGEKETALVVRLVCEDHTFQQFLKDWTKSLDGNMAKHPYLMPLFGGYLCQTAASKTSDQDAQPLLLALAIDHYTTVLQSKADGNTKYFSQMQLSFAHLNSGAEWPQVEEMLMHASDYHKDRGEALKAVIQHYRVRKEYGIAYMMSAIAMQSHLGKVPADVLWFVEPSFYQWKILNYHASICKHIGNGSEARETFDKLFKIATEHQEYFSHDQLQTIYQTQNAYQS